MFKKAAILFIIFLVAFLAWASHQFNSPAEYSQSKHVIIERGSGTNKILAQLKAEGVIENPLATRIFAKLKGISNLKYGEYIFAPNLSPAQILETMQQGAVVKRKITIPEGKTIYDIAQILQASEGLSGQFPTNIAEGSILPQTYYYQWGDTYEGVIAQMQKSMKTAIDRAWEFRRMDLPFETKEEAIILASIVEKETGGEDERGMVASVFTNRLRIGMPLQSDPTAVYGITAGAPLGHLPTGADMKVDSPYNTYTNKGLPPGPICNPGYAAIEAVLNPADTDYLYFVANGFGGHNFSSTLAGHNNNVNVYRKARTLSKRQKSEMIIKP